jgi:hypothetical protein
MTPRSLQPAGAPPSAARVGRIVVHAGSDPRAAQRLVRRLPGVLSDELAGREISDRRELERLVLDAAREARS